MPAEKKVAKTKDGSMKYNEEGELYFDLDLDEEKEDESEDVDLDEDVEEDEEDEEDTESEEDQEDEEDEDEEYEVEEEDTKVTAKKKKTTEVTSVSKRLEAMESALTKLPEMIAQGIAAAVGGKKKKDEDEEDEFAEFEGVDMSQPTNIAKMMRKIIKTQIDAEIKPVQEDVKLNRVRRDFEALYAEEGETFRKKAPLVAKLMGAVPGLSVRDAWSQIKSLSPKVKMTKTQVKKKVRRQEVDADNETIGRERKKSKERRGSLKDTIAESLQELRANSRD